MPKRSSKLKIAIPETREVVRFCGEEYLPYHFTKKAVAKVDFAKAATGGVSPRGSTVISLMASATGTKRWYEGRYHPRLKVLCSKDKDLEGISLNEEEHFLPEQGPQKALAHLILLSIALRGRIKEDYRYFSRLKDGKKLDNGHSRYREEVISRILRIRDFLQLHHRDFIGEAFEANITKEYGNLDKIKELSDLFAHPKTSELTVRARTIFYSRYDLPSESIITSSLPATFGMGGVPAAGGGSSLAEPSCESSFATSGVAKEAISPLKEMRQSSRKKSKKIPSRKRKYVSALKSMGSASAALADAEYLDYANEQLLGFRPKRSKRCG